MTTFLPLILIGVVIGFAGYWVYQFYVASGQTADKLFSVFHSSATIVVARVGAMLSLIGGAAISWAGDPSIQEWLKGVLNPKYSWAALLGYAIIVELARYRSIEKDDE